jgi:hypothetical protein
MNTSTETIPTDFDPDTVFEITLQTANEKHPRATRIPSGLHPVITLGKEFDRRGIPESALHD